MARTAPRMSPAETTKAWQDNAKNGIGAAQAGVGRVTENPAEKAIKSLGKAKQNYAAAIDSGRMEAGLRTVTLEDWKRRTQQKMGERMAAGIDAATDKRRRFDEHNHQVLTEIMPMIAAMPSNTLQDSINRAAKFITERAARKYKK